MKARFAKEDGSFDILGVLDLIFGFFRGLAFFFG